MVPGTIPRGIEVLVRKAAIDAEFKDLLLAQRAEAAREIGLELEPAEILILQAISAEQLEKTIAGTRVPEEHRRVFLGKVASAMLAVLGITMVGGCGGSRPDRPREIPKGIEPDRPPGQKKETEPPGVETPPPPEKPKDQPPSRPPNWDHEPTKGIRIEKKPYTEPKQ